MAPRATYRDLMMPQIKLTRFNGNLQMIFRRGKCASGVLGKGTRQVIGFVKINKKFLALLVRIGVMITPGWISGLAVGLIHELDEETAVGFFSDQQLVIFSVEFKRNISMHGEILAGSENIRQVDDLG